ncbi:hypothetical protein C8A03DRAFT_20036 [Achaetomium macrosporum]|uniref:Uncharacterized protein n=1 Tax=Achaetomium macrosporum TaxID=79813 RepID=A0AAN7H2U3_9PEZI|nr:hypothetical protein C8A03DRAFT_20036 [Achaetomium macrosporum]
MPSSHASDDDDISVHSVVLATADLPNPPMTLEEKREEMLAAHRLIQAKYEAGIPFFTKELFRDVVRQLECNNNPEQRVSVTGLDGFAVQFPIETGKEYEYYSPGDDRTCIMYVSAVTFYILSQPPLPPKPPLVF